MSLPYKTEHIPLAKSLRKDMTRQERHLWYDFLRDAPVRVQRQKAIGPYIVDFYCHSAKIVIELDGGQHFEAEGLQADKERDRFLTSLGLRILRFSNLDVDNHFLAVCEQILGSLREGAVSEAD